MERQTGGTYEGHILLVDGDEHSRRISSTVLQHRGFIVWASDDCAGAMSKASCAELRVLLVNPHDCEQVALAELRETATARGIPTLALTSRVTEPELATLCSQGFDAVLLKPISPNAVLEAVHTALRLVHQHQPGREN